MEVSSINDQLCVELDTGSIFSDYADYIQNFNDTSAKITYDLTVPLHSQTSRTASGVSNAYREGDAVMGVRAS